MNVRVVPPGVMFVVATGVSLTLAWIVGGEKMFSPGGLQAESREGRTIGGVRSHAELSDRCAACHAPPLSGDTMSGRCQACHTNIREQIVSERPLHGKFVNARECRICHTEHQGAHAEITDFALFNHDATAFPLTGAHRNTACTKCHREESYRGTPQNCSACHSEPKVHHGKFGLACATCHSTTTWKNAKVTAEFHKFPIHHGGGKNRGTCATCHNNPNDYRIYTCYGCHRHAPDKTAAKHLKWKIVELQDCAKCHPTGRKRPDLPSKTRDRGRDHDD